MVVTKSRNSIKFEQELLSGNFFKYLFSGNSCKGQQYIFEFGSFEFFIEVYNIFP